MIRRAFLIGTVVLAGAGVVATAFHLASNDDGRRSIAVPVPVPVPAKISIVDRRDFVARSTAAVVAAVAAGTGGLIVPNAANAIDDDGDDDVLPSDPYAEYTTSESGMRYLITREGDGAVPSAGQLVKVRFTPPTPSSPLPRPAFVDFRRPLSLSLSLSLSTHSRDFLLRRAVHSRILHNIRSRRKKKISRSHFRSVIAPHTTMQMHMRIK